MSGRWPSVRLDGVTTERRTSVLPSDLGPEVFHYSIPVWDEIGDGRIEPSEEIGSHKLRIDGGELLVSKLNPRKSRVLEAEAQSLPTVASSEFVVLRPSPKVWRRFLAYWFLAESTRQGLDRQVQSVTRSQQRVAPDAISKAWLRLPPLDEQRRIADFLDAETSRIDSLITKRQRQIELLEERSATVIDATIGARWLRRADGVPFGIEGVRSVRLGSVALVQTGVTLHGGRPAGPTDVEVPYLRVANVHDGSIDTDEVKSVRLPSATAARSLLQRGDVLMTEGGDPDKLGRGAVWDDRIEPCVHQNHVFAVRPDRSLLTSEYLAMITRTSYARAYFEMTASKTTGIASTSSAKIAAFRVPLPSVEEQMSVVHQYEHRVAAIRRAKRALDRQIELLRERRQALITAAVTGEITVP